MHSFTGTHPRVPPGHGMAGSRPGGQLQGQVESGWRGRGQAGNNRPSSRLGRGQAAEMRLQVAPVLRVDTITAFILIISLSNGACEKSKVGSVE